MRAVDTNVLVRLLTRDDEKQVAPEVIAAAPADFRARPSLGFSDCLMLAVARKAGHLPHGTFDRAFAKLEGAVKV